MTMIRMVMMTGDWLRGWLSQYTVHCSPMGHGLTTVERLIHGTQQVRYGIHPTHTTHATLATHLRLLRCTVCTTAPYRYTSIPPHCTLHVCCSLSAPLSLLSSAATVE